MKRIISLFLISVIVASVSAVGTSAAIWYPDHIYGDVDGDNDVTAADATIIRRYCTLAYTFDSIQQEAADYDRNNEIELVDATFIQRKATLITVPDYCGGTFTEENKIIEFFASYNTNKAMVGVPVEFTAEAKSGTAIVDYTFYVRRSYSTEPIYTFTTSENKFSYTFDEAGLYTISVRSKDKLGSYNYNNGYSQNSIIYNVVEPYSLDKPVISYFNLQRGEAKAIGGTAPYKYKFILLDGSDNKDISSDAVIEDIWKFSKDETYGYILTTEYIDQDTVPDILRIAGEYGFDRYGNVRALVTAIDANGDISEPQVAYFTYLEG